MTRSTTKKLTEPLDEPEREFRRLRRAAWRQQQNESLAIAGINLFDDEASSSNNTRVKPSVPSKTLQEHSLPSTAGSQNPIALPAEQTGRIFNSPIAGINLFDDEASSSNNTRVKPSVPSKTLQEHSLPSTAGSQNPIALPAEQTGRIFNSRDILLIQGMCTFQGLRSEDPLRHIRHYLSIVDNIQADEATRDTLRLRFFYFSHKGKMAEWLNKIPPTQITTWDQLLAWETRPVRSLSFQFSYEEEDWNRIEEYVHYQDDLWDEPSPPMDISSISGNDDVPPWGNSR
uniref:Uncharacterized protein n=1 Tax=Tanacetum cinerariifolium TaxID=118510 RepID=A0A699IM06_TANCI|nr:hypothetical protein [Tanacetum cinerariifolium]